MKSLAFAANIFLGILFVATSSFALTIDEFTDFGKAEVVLETPNTASTNVVSTSAIGGNRLLYIARTGTPLSSSPFNGGSTNIYSNTRLFHNQDSEVRAFSRVTWDKDGDANNAINPSGLGSVDITQDGGDALQARVSFDYGNTQPIDITIRLFDSSDPSGSTYSDIAITLNQVLTNFVLNIPFSAFQTFGGKSIAGPGNTSFSAFTYFPSGQFVNLTRVGAIVLEINGQNGDSDLSLDYIKTNGRCSSVPDSSGKVVDGCGVCHEDTANVLLPDGKKDRCGICLTKPAVPNYDYNSNKVFDACNLCPSDANYNFPNGAKDSCGLCPSAPNYTVAKDPCGVCFGDGSSCADCSGTPNGGKIKDICGVCDGKGTTCLDCSGTPFGTKILDTCNVCGGDGTSCLKNLCVTVAATSDILAFEKRLVDQTKTITKKYKEEENRGKKNKCGINTKPSTTRVNSAYKTIVAAGKDIFTKGVEICGDSCVTVSFADQVTALAPKLKIIENETTTLAKKVQACYKKKKIKTTQGIAGVATTIKNVTKDLTQLVKDCKDKQVCPH